MTTSKTERVSFHPRRLLLRGGIILVIFVLGLAFTWQRIQGPKVDAIRVHRQPVLNRVVATGRVLPLARFHLGSVVLGTVSTVSAQEGEVVTKGQMLVQFDDAEARAALAQAKASLHQSEAKLAQLGGVEAKVALESVRQALARKEQATKDLEREESLFASGASTQEKVDDAQKSLEIASSAHAAAEMKAGGSGPGGSEYRAAVSSVAQYRAAVQAAQAKLDHTRIQAPENAVVLTRSVEPGDVVQPGKTLFVLAQTGWTGLVVQVDEKNLSLLRLGQEATASADAYPGERFDAKVVFLAPLVDAARGTVEVKLEVSHPPSYLRTDMTVSVVVDGGKREDVLLIPGAALRDATLHRPYVFSVESGRVARRNLVLGVRADDHVEVVEGLEPSALVILSGGMKLEEGQRVRAREVSPKDGAHAL